jgi:hypothetical protein
VVILGALVATAGSALAQTQPFAFVGSAVIVDLTGPDCASVNVQVGELHTSVFRPTQAGVGAASLQFLQNIAAVRITPSINGDFAASGQYSARMFTGRAGYVEFTGNYSKFRIRPTPTATTPTLDISGKITNFKNANCTVTFTGGYVLKPAN